LDAFPFAFAMALLCASFCPRMKPFSMLEIAFISVIVTPQGYIN